MLSARTQWMRCAERWRLGAAAITLGLTGRKVSVNAGMSGSKCMCLRPIRQDDRPMGRVVHMPMCSVKASKLGEIKSDECAEN